MKAINLVVLALGIIVLGALIYIIIEPLCNKEKSIRYNKEYIEQILQGKWEYENRDSLRENIEVYSLEFYGNKYKLHTYKKIENVTVANEEEDGVYTVGDSMIILTSVKIKDGKPEPSVIFLFIDEKGICMESNKYISKIY